MEDFDKRTEIDSIKQIGDESREPMIDEVQAAPKVEVHNRPKSKLVIRLLLLAVVALLAVYFFKNGCNLNNIGNQQKVEVSKPGDIYRLR